MSYSMKRKSEMWKKMKKGGRDDGGMICVRVAHSLSLFLTFRQLTYLISDTEYLIERSIHASKRSGD